MKKSLINKLEKAGDVATNLATNGALVLGGLEGIEYLDKLDYSTTTQALAAIGATLGINYLNKKGVVKGFSKGINTFARNIKGKAMPLVRNAVLAGAITLAGYGLVDKGKNVYKDFSNTNEDKKEIIVQENIKVVHPDNTLEGKFERTYRWDKVLDEVEEKYKIPRGTLKGLAMRESYGDPLRLNEGGDGGAGLFMFQPGTADEYGLEVYGYSRKTGIDKKHGRELKELVMKNRNDYSKLAEIDERFDVLKSSEAAGKFLSKLYIQHKSWDKALSAYNRGSPAINPLATRHVKAVKEYQDYYNKRDRS